MNPEFQRQCWLELSGSRIGVLLGGIVGLFTLLAFIDRETGSGMAMPMVAAVTFIALGVAWGGHRAGESMLSELRERTWDTQKLSALSPWRMLWGKWLGSTSLVWLSGLVCLIVFMATAKQLTPTIRYLIGLQALTGAVFVQGLSLIGALTIAGHPKRLKGPLAARMVALICGFAYAYFAFRLGSDETLTWFGRQWHALSFSTGLLVVTTAWIIVGAYRLMCHELQVPTRPWCWLLFLIYTSGVTAGFFVTAEVGLANFRILSVTGLMCALGATYVCAFTLFRDPLALRRITRYGKDGQWRRAAEEAPLWLCSLALGILWTVICTVFADGVIAPERPVENIGLAGIPLLLFVVRDLLILFATSHGPHPEKAETTTMIYLGLLYWLAPALFEMLGLVALSEALRPPFLARPLQATVVLLIQVCACAWWAYAGYRRRTAPRA